ncbi:MAG: hypothetical protein H0T60_17535 [Acidobacteria bacterium]|nr:hypothetical protein [Acidobacteriota bacterium]
MSSSPPFPETDAEIEAMVRGLVAAKCAAVEGTGHVFTQRFYVVGKQAYVDKLGIESSADGNYEVRCLFVEFVGYEDLAKGCEDAPHYHLIYSMRAVQEFADVREDESSSSQEFAAYVMNLRAAFLTARDLGFPARLHHEPLSMDERIRIDDDEMTGVFGHIAPFVLKVEVVPNG